MISDLMLTAMGVALFAMPRRYLKWLVLEVERLITQLKRSTVETETHSDVFVAKNGTPQENVAKVIAMMGGLNVSSG